MKSWKVDIDIDAVTNINTNIDDDIKPKKKQLIYETLKIWYKCFDYFNIKNILQLAADSMSGIVIKDSKMMDFCEAYALAGFK